MQHAEDAHLDLREDFARAGLAQVFAHHLHFQPVQVGAERVEGVAARDDPLERAGEAVASNSEGCAPFESPQIAQ